MISNIKYKYIFIRSGQERPVQVSANYSQLPSPAKQPQSTEYFRNKGGGGGDQGQGGGGEQGQGCSDLNSDFKG